MKSQQWDNNGGNVQFQGTATNPTFHMYVEHRQSRDRCLEYFAVTDPRDTKTNIHQTRGATLKDSYEWIFRHPQFQCWRDSNDSQVLWVKGDPGKGKTMLLCGIIDELRSTTMLEDPKAKTSLSFFFCQATDPKLSNAHAVLRGLIYMLVDMYPPLLSCARKRFKDTGEPLFGDAEAWAVLCNIFSDILHDSSLDMIYIVVDALDECVQDRDKLLQLILLETRELPHVKWIISSRNHVMKHIRLDDSQSILSLELQENAEAVSLAIGAYISNRIAEFESLEDDDTLREYVQQTLQMKAEGTFLWVALVVQELQGVDSWDVKQVVDNVPTGLDDMYARMIHQIEQEAPRTREFCQLVLSTATLAYRPLQLLELGVVSGLPGEIAGKVKSLVTIIKRSGSFLTVRDESIYFVHQSAKDYLMGKGGQSIFSSGPTVAHRRIFTQSLQIMRKTLRRDMYSLHALVTRYSCVYWVDHLRDSGSYEDVQDSGTVDTFLRTQCLYWFEALSLLRSISDGIMSIQGLRDLLSERSAAAKLSSLAQDAYRFILYHRGAIENHPLQVYGCGLVFSPSRSMIKELFWHERPKDIMMMPWLGNDWDAHTGACLQTLEGHDFYVNSVAFSHDSSRVASGSDDKTIKIWDAHTGACLQTLEGHGLPVDSVVFSPDSSRVASGSGDKTIKIWDAHTGACLQTLEGHGDWVRSVVFSHDSSRVASGSNDKTIKIWDAHTGACLKTLEGHDLYVNSVVFSHDSSRVASGSLDKTIKIWDAHTGACLKTLEGHGLPVNSVIWDAHTGACLQTLEGHYGTVNSVVFSHDSSRVASGSNDKTIKIWDAHSGACLQTLEGHGLPVNSVVFSPNSSRVASGSGDKTIKIWDAHTGACLQTLEGHGDWIRSVVFSHDSSRVASGSWDETIKIWDAHTGACLQTLEGHDRDVRLVVFSHDSSCVASGSWDRTIKIWDAHTGACLQTLQGHDRDVNSVVFSHDSSRVASGSNDKTIKIWDAHTGACLQTLEGHDGYVTSVVFSSDSSHVASGSLDKTIKIWDAHTGACLQTLQGHDRDVNSAVFSHDSSRVASGSRDKTIKIWDAHTGTCLQTLNVGSGVNILSFGTTNSSLHTDLGIVALRDSLTPTTSTPTEVAALELQSPSKSQPLQKPAYQGYGISSDGFWITRRSQKWLWLPPTYRPACSAVGRSGLTVVLGCQSGRVLIFRFAPKGSN
ncbi:Vegetative incompatibility protein HET-E-1 [Penicillium cosmopolitanum]|uniref:Mitochondrial division protein 1 n=1 Tax=Penicillium cosmopolitanum TaxID=1131564 RepID=A0A9W9VEX4_9EURO|nr:Vegetative incompatibility protein HET-E-1 [Penicillium cosmopolitanum]KAJ5379598.1 Vegetative incompatibility protein HET-E-1 [Penicillium cosmopolitanum]